MAAQEKAIQELVALLNSHDTTEAEGAEAALKPYGAAILPPLLEAVPGFGRFGQLCVIELMQDAGDPRAPTVLIPMLRSEHDTVRERAATALGDLQIEDAVPENAKRLRGGQATRDATRLDGTPSATGRAHPTRRT